MRKLAILGASGHGKVAAEIAELLKWEVYFFDDNKLFGIAGLWEEFEDSSGEPVHTFSILTTAANELVRQSGTRMPVIIPLTEAMTWLDADITEAHKLLNSFPEGNMNGFAVSNRVNDITQHGQELIEPAPPADQFGNYSLFD